MDSKRFSELTKALASGQSRRGVVKGLAAGFAGGMLGLVGRGDAEAARKKTGPGRVCRENANCLDGLLCLYDPPSRRRKCTCINPVCYEKCVFTECVDVNFTINQGPDCEQQCAYDCLDPSCRLFLNQQPPR
jgi:hypothetical protein